MSFPRPPINLVLLKRPPLEVPYVLDDTVLSVQHMLQRAGYPTLLSYNTIDPRLVNIVFGIYMPGTASIQQIRALSSPANTVIFNSEQLGSTSPWITDEYLRLLRDYVCLDYNQANIDHLQGHWSGQARAFEFPILPSMEFRSDYPMTHERWQMQYDLAFYGSTANGGRVGRLMELADLGVRLKCFAGSFGRDLPMELMECTAVLNIHAYDSALFELGRCLRPAALGMPIFSDVSIHPGKVNWADSGIFFLPREGFAQSVSAILRDSERMLDASQRMLQFVNDAQWPKWADYIMQQTLFALSHSA